MIFLISPCPNISPISTAHIASTSIKITKNENIFGPEFLSCPQTNVCQRINFFDSIGGLGVDADQGDIFSIFDAFCFELNNKRLTDENVTWVRTAI